jgi:hypothetical protein
VDKPVHARGFGGLLSRMQEQRKSKPTAEQLPRIDRAGARRLIASAGPDAGRDGGHQWGGAARSWFIKTSSWHAIVVYGAVLAGVMTASLEGPQHAWSSGGLLGSPPDSGAGSKEFTMMKKMSAAGVAAVMIASQTMAGDAVQWRVEDGGNGHWYQVLELPTPVTLVSATAAAEARGAHVVTVTTEIENTFVYSVANVDNAWASSEVGPLVGLSVDTSLCGAGCWVTGEPVEFTYWHPGNPDHPTTDNCVYLYGRADMRWQNHPCGCLCWGVACKAAIIEWSADCNNDGIVDYSQCQDGSLPDTNANNIPDCCEQGVSCNNVDPCASQTVLLVDDFEAPALDSLQWDVRLPYACSLVQQGGGEVLMQARGHLVTRGEFSPSSGAVRLEYTFRYIAGGEGFEVSMLTNDDIGGTCCSQPNNGLMFALVSWQVPTMAFVVGSANLQITNVVHNGSITVSAGDTFHVDLELTKTAIHADIRKEGSPIESMSVSATWAGTPLGNKVAFFDREFCDARSAITNVRISRSGLIGADCDTDGISDACDIASGAPDINHNNIPDTCECIGDVYVDGIINGGDLGVLLAYWGPTTSAAASIACDLNVDGLVNGSDLGILLASWGPCSN